MYHVQCPLGHALEIEAEHLGQRLMCPLCQAVVHSAIPRPGEPPLAKYEVQCSQGHILRVKQKYLWKEVRCPSCQEMVSMAPGNLLTQAGATLAMTVPDLVVDAEAAYQKKLAKAKAEQKPTQSPPAQRDQLTPPPVQRQVVPLQPEVVEDSLEDMPSLPPPRPEKAHPAGEGHLELEIVDTQFQLEMNSDGTYPKSARPKKKDPPSGRIPEPPARSQQKHPPTGFHPLTQSEFMKVQAATSDTDHQPKLPSSASTLPNISEEIQVTCSQGHLLAIERQYLGKQVQCPLCQEVLQVPQDPEEKPAPSAPTQIAAAVMQMSCPLGHMLEVETKYQGQQVQCPLCNAVMEVPFLAEELPVAEVDS